MKKLLFVLFVSLSTSYVKAQGEGDLSRDSAIDEMIRKICIIARDKLKIQHTDPEKKVLILEYMRKKLKQTLGDKYTDQGPHVKLILQGISILSDDKNYQEICLGKRVLRRFLDNYMSDTNIDTTKDPEDETPQVKGVLLKMEKLVKNVIANASTLEEKRQNVETLKEHLIETFTNELGRNGKDENKTKEYVRLLSDSVDLTMQKLLDNEVRRMTVVFRSDIKGDDDIEARAVTEKSLPFNMTNTFVVTTPTIPKSTPLVGVTKAVDTCAESVKQTCADLKQLDLFTCPNGKTIKDEHVCDGVTDCPDGSDEENCIKQVVGKVHRATKVMSKIELSKSCFKNLFDNSLISRHGALLTELLNGQIEYLKRYTLKHSMPAAFTTAMPKRNSKDAGGTNLYHHEPVIDQVVSEVALVLRTFGVSLNSALCLEVSPEVDRAVALDDLENLGTELEKEGDGHNDWSSNMCDCGGPYCKNNTCHPYCRVYCYKLYNLGRFRCKSVTQGQESISIDLICDGRVDCLDETDEMGCTDEFNNLSKFEGNKYYDTVITMLKTKFLTRGFETVRVPLIEIQAHVQKMQKRGLSPKVNEVIFKHLRDMYFKLVKSIYIELVDTVDNEKTTEEVYDFLMDLNLKLIEALKRTHTGNKKVISPDNCYCRGSECASLECTPRCKRSCVARNLLTNYICSDPQDANVTTAPIDSICNGNINCPNAKDELKCSPEICRVHHAKVLKHNIKTVGEKYKGTLMGDALDSWKDKVLPSLVVLESRERVTPRLIKNTVSQVLNDLSLAYISLDQYRRLDLEPILKKFTKLSQRMIESLKTCTK